MAQIIQLQIRRDTSANWTSTNPVLAAGEWATETDTDCMKIGNGVTAWTALGYWGVNKVGTPVNNQISIWTDDKTIEGVAQLTYTDVGSTPNLFIGDNTAASISTNLTFQSSSTGRGSIIFQQTGTQRAKIGFHDSIAGSSNVLRFESPFGPTQIVTTNVVRVLIDSNGLELLSQGQIKLQATATPQWANVIGFGQLYMDSADETLHWVDGAGGDSNLSGQVDHTGLLNIGTNTHAQIDTHIGIAVTKVGTPVNNQIGVWTGDGTLNGTSALRNVGGNLTSEGGYVGVSLDLINGVGGAIQTFQETSAPLDEKNWIMGAFSSEFFFQTKSDDFFTTTNDILKATRTGAVVDLVTIGAPLTVTNNVAIGATALLAWSTSFDVLQLGTVSSIYGGTAALGATVLGRNVYHDGANKYIATDQAQQIVLQGTGDILLRIAPSPTPITAGSFVGTTEYRIETIGTTDFTLIGAASNTVGLVFTATGVGSGTGTATPTLIVWTDALVIDNATADATFNGRISKVGTALVAGDFALSAGWGTTASVGTIVGNDQRCSFIVTSTGTGQAANPTITLTFTDGAWPVAPVAISSRKSGSQLSVVAVVTSTTTTTVVITFIGTPVAAETFGISLIAIG